MDIETAGAFRQCRARRHMNIVPKRILFVSSLIAAFALVGEAQTSWSGPTGLEREIRKLDLAAAEAILKKDEAGIDRYFAADSVTNNPRGGITIGNAGVKELFKTGVIDYAEFTREIEKVQVRGSSAVVMGSETITTRQREGRPAETYRRRYTNVWMKRGGRWQIIARHASVICP